MHMYVCVCVFAPEFEAEPASADGHASEGGQLLTSTGGQRWPVSWTRGRPGGAFLFSRTITHPTAGTSQAGLSAYYHVGHDEGVGPRPPGSAEPDPP